MAWPRLHDALCDWFSFAHESDRGLDKSEQLRAGTRGLGAPCSSAAANRRDSASSHCGAAAAMGALHSGSGSGSGSESEGSVGVGVGAIEPISEKGPAWCRGRVRQLV